MDTAEKQQPRRAELHLLHRLPEVLLQPVPVSIHDGCIIGRRHRFFRLCDPSFERIALVLQFGAEGFLAHLATIISFLINVPVAITSLPPLILLPCDSSCIFAFCRICAADVLSGRLLPSSTPTGTDNIASQVQP